MELLVLWIGCLFMGYFIGAGKGVGGVGLVLAVFLGPLGVLIVLCLPNSVKLEAETVQMRMRAEELRVQKEILHELRAQRISNQAQTPPPLPAAPPPTIIPQQEDEPLSDFVPENLRGRRPFRARKSPNEK